MLYYWKLLKATIYVLLTGILKFLPPTSFLGVINGLKPVEIQIKYFVRFVQDLTLYIFKRSLLIISSKLVICLGIQFPTLEFELEPKFAKTIPSFRVFKQFQTKSPLLTPMWLVYCWQKG